MMTSILQLKITLNEIKPPVWRRILVQDSIDFYDLHLVIQESMGWRDIYLFGFNLDEFYINSEFEEDCWSTKKIFLEPNVDTWRQTQEERETFLKNYQEYQSREKLILSDFINREKQKIKYEYNFKYGWKHTIIVEKILPDNGNKYPICLKGKRACPPDSINLEIRGAIAYMTICEKLKENPDSKKEFRKEYKELYKKDFDPEYFSVEEVNMNLENILNSLNCFLK